VQKEAVGAFSKRFGMEIFLEREAFFSVDKLLLSFSFSRGIRLFSFSYVFSHLLEASSFNIENLDLENLI